MFGSGVLEIAIGLFLLYLILSTVCSAVNEAISALFTQRARTLQQGIRAMLNDPKGNGLAAQFFAHPLIKSLQKPGSNQPPSYIPAHLFATTLLDIVVPNSGSMTFDAIRKHIATIPKDHPLVTEELKTSLQLLVDQTEATGRNTRERLEQWFDNAMERTSEWYKRRQAQHIVIIALLLTILLNADTFMIGSALARDQALRAAVVAAAEARLQAPPGVAGTPTPQEAVDRARAEIDVLGALGFPLGWTNVPLLSPPPPAHAKPLPTDIPRDLGDGIKKLLGLLVTAAALSFGAPFWFDLLNRVTNLRAAGQPPKRTGETPEDQPAPSARGAPAPGAPSLAT
jgi:hypothetical protein